MHIDRVQLENFGIYHRRTLDLGQSNLILLYGPNESGKTTALNGLRQALFGFRARTPYLSTGRTMSAEVSGWLANGQRLNFTRRKGRQDDVEGTLNGRKLDSDAIVQLLGNLDLSSYEQLFGFSLEELRKGEESLKSAQLSEALAGGGLTGINSLQRLRSDLQITLADLYKARGSRSEINQRLTDIQNTKAELAKVQVLPSEVEDLQRQQQELLQKSEQLKEEHASAFQYRAATQRLLEILPNYRRHQQLKQQLSSVQLPAGVDMHFVNNWSEHSETRKNLLKLLEQETSQLRQDQLALDSLGGASELAEQEEAIEHLGHQADEISALRKRAIDLRETVEDSQAICKRLCETLQLIEVDDAIRAFVVTPPMRRDLENMSRDVQSIAEQQIANTARLDAARRSLASLELVAEDEIPPNNLDELAHRLKDLQASEEHHNKLAAAFTELVQSSSMDQLEQQLAAQASGAQLSPDWVLPNPQVVHDAGQVRSGLLIEQTQLSKEIAALENEIAVAEDQLGNIDQSAIEKILADLEKNRQQREQCFYHWEDDLTQPLIAPSITPELQSERLQELHALALQADQLQQLLMESAETVASYQAGQKQLTRMREHQQKLQLAFSENQQYLQNWAADWNGLWSKIGVVPQSPELMLEWLAGFSRWREHQQRLASARRELHIARGVVRQQRVSLLDFWPVSLREDTATELLATRLIDWQNTQRDLQRDQGRLRSAQLQIDQWSSEAEQLSTKRQALEGRYHRWLATAPITQTWPIEQVSQLIDSIEHLRREDDTARKSAMELAIVQERLEGFDREAKRLARLIQREIAEHLPTETLVRSWFDEMRVMRDERLQRAKLSAAIEHRQQRVVELTADKQSLDERLASLIAASGSTDMQGMSSIVELVQRAEQLRQEFSECLATIEGQAAGQDLTALMDQLSQSDEIELRLAVEEFSRQLEHVDLQRKETDQCIGSLDQRIEQLARSGEAGRLAFTLHHQRNQLGELCEQWVVHRLAAELLDRAVDRFSREHEPALLQYTRDFLHRLTGGRYQDVEHDPANPTQFIVRSASGQAFEPDRLSTGTREQLYLAIRMAFVTHYCESHEPLPVIMDDCFVNFDDYRTAHALAAISQWSTGAQRILLSCHFRVVQSLAEIAPETPCIHLEREERTTVGELASEIVIR